MILSIGNVGSGKTLLANRFLVNGAVRASSDDILKLMHGSSTIYLKELKEVYHQIQQDIIGGALARGFDVYIDRTNIDKGTRENWFSIARFASEMRAQYKRPPVRVIAYDFGPGREADLERRQATPHGETPSKWKEVFAMFRDKYEKPEKAEGFEEIHEIDNRRFKFFSFDFDGVIVENKFPEIGNLNEPAIATMREIWENPHNYIIVYTCREDDASYSMDNDRLRLSCIRPYLSEVKSFLRGKKIPHDTINVNPWYPHAGKMFAHYYVDDRNISLDDLGLMVTHRIIGGES
jgi:hypothetical protein